MDELARTYYEQAFEIRFLRNRGDAFQDMVATIMEKRHPGDFQRSRPWGNAGDRKNDGYVKNTRTMLQVYAPNELSAATACAKIDEDFAGALEHWEQHVDRWVFVHNSREGLGPQVLDKLLECERVLLSRGKAPGSVEHWGFEELRQRLFELSEHDLASVLGPAPSQRRMVRLGMEPIVGSSRVDLQACKLEYSIVSPK